MAIEKISGRAMVRGFIHGKFHYGPHPMAKIIPLSNVDPAAVEALLDAAFGADRKTRTAYKLRVGTQAISGLSFACQDGVLLGTIQCWPIALDGTTPLTLVGPVAVAPEAQGKGVGKALMNNMLAAAENHGHTALVMIGDPEYYGRFFGFRAEPTQGWTLPGPFDRHRLLARVAQGVELPKTGMLGPRV
jgi:predicted N-acetyltransferase YhbS